MLQGKANHKRRLSQNQYIGLKEFLPLSFYAGASYIAYDEEELYIYNSDEKPILINPLISLEDGSILAPDLTDDLIDNDTTGQSIITKNWFTANNSSGSKLQEKVSDSFNGTRLEPINTALHGFHITKNVDSGRIGYEAVNTNSTGSAVFVARLNSSQLYQDYLYAGIYGSSYYATAFRNKGILQGYNGLEFISANNNDFNWWTGGSDVNLNAFSIALTLKNTGELVAPLLTIAKTDTESTGKVVTTREYLENHWKVKISLSAAQVKTLGATPIIAIPAPGAGKIINLISFIGKLNWNSVAFDANPVKPTMNSVDLFYGTENVFLSATSNQIETSNKDDGNSNALVENTAVYISGTDSVATGDSTVDIYLTYEIITL